MKGRKLVFDFGEHVIAIEIYPKNECQSRYQVPDKKTGLLFDISDFDGECIERFVGESAAYPYGRDLNGHVPEQSPMAWMTKAEADSDAWTWTRA